MHMHNFYWILGRSLSQSFWMFKHLSRKYLHWLSESYTELLIFLIKPGTVSRSNSYFPTWLSSRMNLKMQNLLTFFLNCLIIDAKLMRTNILYLLSFQLLRYLNFRWFTQNFFFSFTLKSQIVDCFGQKNFQLRWLDKKKSEIGIYFQKSAKSS